MVVLTLNSSFFQNKLLIIELCDFFLFFGGFVAEVNKKQVPLSF